MSAVVRQRSFTPICLQRKTARYGRHVAGYSWRPACLLLVMLTCLSACTAAYALQPAFISGTIYDSYTKTRVSGATVTTSDGLSLVATAGSFVLRLPPDVYDMVFSCNGYRSNILAGVVAVPGQTTNVTVWLTPSSNEFGTVEGYVRSRHSGDAISKAFVATDLGGLAITNRDGFFRMLGPSGSALLTIAATGFESKAVQSFDVLPNQTVFLIDFLQQTSTTHLAASGIITDACTGERIINSAVVSMSGDLDLSADGFFSLDIPTGFTTLVATAEGYQCSYKNLSLIPLPQITSLGLHLVPSRRGSGLLFGLVSDSVTGRLLEHARFESNTGAITFSRANGAYQLYTNLCTSYLDISLQGYDELQIPVSFTGSNTSSLNVQLKPRATLAGRVIDATDNHTIAGATLFISEQPEITSISGADGSYVISDVKPGRSTVNVARRCYLPSQQSFDAVAGQNLILNIAITAQAYASIQGTVTDKFTHRPISGAQLATDSGAYGFTDDLGAFLLTVPACEAVLTITAEGYLPQTAAVHQLSEHDTEHIDCELIACPFFQLLGGSPFQDDQLIFWLRSCRNKMLSESPLGREYVRLFYLHAPEISLVLFQDGFLLNQAAALLQSAAHLPLACSEGELALNSFIEEATAFFEAFLQSGASVPLCRYLERIIADLNNGRLLSLYLDCL